MARKYKIKLMLDNQVLLELKDNDNIEYIYKILDKLDEDDLNNVKLDITATISASEGCSIGKRGPRAYKEDYKISDVSNEKLKSILVSIFGFNPNDIELLDDGMSLVLFNDPEDWEINLTPEDDLLNIAIYINNLAKNENKINEMYIETSPGNYTVYSASDLKNPEDQIALVDIGTDSNNNLYIKNDYNFTDDYLIYYKDSSDAIENGKRFTLDDIYDFLVKLLEEEKSVLSEDELKAIQDERKKKNLRAPKKDIKYLTKYLEELGYEVTSTDALDKESVKIATDVLNNAKKSGKSNKDTLVRLDKTLNHNDPFFSVEFDRSISNSGYELFAQQTLRTLRDDLKAVANNKNSTEDDIVNKFTELTGVDYYTDKVVDKDQYNQLLILLMKDPRDAFNYVPPKENEYVQRTKDLTEDLIEKVLLRQDPDFYNH